MNKPGNTFATLWNKTKSLSPLIPLALVSLILALLLGAGNDPAGASPLFQSPPQEEPTATPPPPEPIATPLPTETPVPPAEPTVTPLPPEATTAAPVETPPEAPSEGSPPAPPAETPPEAPTEAPPETTAPTTKPEEEEAPPPAAEESPPLIFNWGAFLNTVIITLSYVWICCGVCGLVGTPLIFILLYIGGKQRLKRRESEDTEQTPETKQTGQDERQS